jgi:ABC-type uncharacterized transport system YnjBCD permease subunit
VVLPQARTGRGEYIPYPSYPAACLIDNALLQLAMMPVALPFFLLIIPNTGSGSGKGFPTGFLWFHIPVILPGLGLNWGYKIFMLMRDQHKQAWHDKLARTCAYRVR